jgi:lipid-A-disaccharide synthase
VTARLLVVTGEASGDHAAAGVVRALRETCAVDVLAMGGAALQATGASLLADVRRTTAMGVGAVLARATGIVGSAARVLLAAAREPLDAALLVNYSDFNAELAPVLHRRGVHVVWYGAPQVWAWRPGRARALRPSIDRMALMLPFEEPLWRACGVSARYVGHPALEAPRVGRSAARQALGLTDRASAVAILPGSRPHEVRSLLAPMLEAADRVRRDRASIDSRVLLAPSLDRDTQRYAHDLARRYGVPTFDVRATDGAGAVLPAFDAALTASGTASLEATLARAVPIVAYRVGLASELLARTLVRTPHYALPNVLLERRAFPELLQGDANASMLATALARSLDSRGELLAACDQVEHILGVHRTPSREVAAMLLPWVRVGRSAAR